jgi:hypothetical protein
VRIRETSATRARGTRRPCCGDSVSLRRAPLWDGRASAMNRACRAISRQEDHQLGAHLARTARRSSPLLPEQTKRMELVNRPCFGSRFHGKDGDTRRRRNGRTLCLRSLRKAGQGDDLAAVGERRVQRLDGTACLGGLHAGVGRHQSKRVAVKVMGPRMSDPRENGERQHQVAKRKRRSAPDASLQPTGPRQALHLPLWRIIDDRDRQAAAYLIRMPLGPSPRRKMTLSSRAIRPSDTVTISKRSRFHFVGCDSPPAGT